jgi:hypothetical protein
MGKNIILVRESSRRKGNTIMERERKRLLNAFVLQGFRYVLYIQSD